MGKEPGNEANVVTSLAAHASESEVAVVRLLQYKQQGSSLLRFSEAVARQGRQHQAHRSSITRFIIKSKRTLNFDQNN